MKSWLVAHPVAGFILLAYGISYLVGAPFLLLVSQWLVPEWGILEGYVPRLFIVFGPGLAGLILARLTQRDGGAVGLVARVIPAGSDLAWSAGIVVTGLIASAAALHSAGFAMDDIIGRAQTRGGLLATHFTLQVCIIAVGEELGWRGWLLPRLTERTSRIKAALVVGAVWALWHAPILASSLMTAAMFILGAMGFSVLFTWLWVQADRRLFTVIVAHATVNAPMAFWEHTTVGGVDERILHAWYAFEAGVALAGLALVVARWRWWRRSELCPLAARP